VYPKRSSTPQKGGSENGCVGIPPCASWTVRVQSRHVDEDPRGFCDLGRSFDAEAGCSATIRARDGNRNEAATHESDAKNSCHLAVHRASSLFNNSRAITRLALFVSFCHVNILLAAAVFVAENHVESSADPIDPSRNASSSVSSETHSIPEYRFRTFTSVVSSSASRHVSSSRLLPFIPALAAKSFESRG